MTAQLAPVENLVDQEAVLKHLGLNPRDVHTQALLAICQRYRLDPLLKHVVLIQGRPYITRDGYLSIAHSTRQLDGIEVLEEGEDKDHWWAKVAVYRKDMSRPFAYRGRYPKEGSGNKQYGPEMAVKCAEVASLRRAFDVTGVGAADERWDVPEQVVEAPTYAGADEARAKELGWGGLHQLAEAHDAFKKLVNESDDAGRERVAAYKREHDLFWPMAPQELDALTAEVRKPEQIVAPEDGQLVDVERPPQVPTSEMDLTPVPYPEGEEPF